MPEPVLPPRASDLPVKSSGSAGFRRVPARYALERGATEESFQARARLFRMLDRRLAPALDQPQLISSVSGDIDRVLLTIPSWVFLEGQEDQDVIDKYANAYHAFLAQLPQSTRFVIMTHRASKAALGKWLRRHGVQDRTEVVPVRNTLRFTVWAEDAYCVSLDRKDGQTFLVEPASFRRGDDALIADHVAAATDLETTLAELYFQGGNLLIGDDFWFIGADYPANSLKLGFIRPTAGESEAEAVRRVYGAKLDQNRTFQPIGSRVPVPAEASRPITIGGEPWDEILHAGNHPGTVQPLFHIDMFMTLAGRSAEGRPIVLVGDPTLAAEILKQEVSQQAMPEVFDDIADQLATLGFEVVRNPLPLVYDDDPGARERVWYFATSNNALVQDGRTKSVWLPTYGHAPWEILAATDEAMKEIWERLGFTVHQLPNFHPFAAKLGAAHCIKKYLRRGAGRRANAPAPRAKRRALKKAR